MTLGRSAAGRGPTEDEEKTGPVLRQTTDLRRARRGRQPNELRTRGWDRTRVDL